MKRFSEALVMMEMIVAIVAMAVVGVCASARAQAASPVVELRADASLSRSPSASAVTLRVDAGFSTDMLGADPFTIQRAVILFPDRAPANGRLFPSCSARRIERLNGNIRRCPKGARIGSGTVKAKAIQLGIVATGDVTMFNSQRGNAVTFNIRTYLPAYINESFDAPLERVRGRYPEKLTLTVPHSLQEILSGVFVGVQEFDVTLDGAIRRNGVVHTYIRARRCPKWPMRGVFDFKDWSSGRTATVTTDAKLRCTAR